MALGQRFWVRRGRQADAPFFEQPPPPAAPSRLSAREEAESLARWRAARRFQLRPDAPTAREVSTLGVLAAALLGLTAAQRQAVTAGEGAAVLAAQGGAAPEIAAPGIAEMPALAAGGLGARSGPAEAALAGAFVEEPVPMGSGGFPLPEPAGQADPLVIEAAFAGQAAAAETGRPAETAAPADDRPALATVAEATPAPAGEAPPARSGEQAAPAEAGELVATAEAGRDAAPEPVASAEAAEPVMAAASSELAFRWTPAETPAAAELPVPGAVSPARAEPDASPAMSPVEQAPAAEPGPPVTFAGRVEVLPPGLAKQQDAAVAEPSPVALPHEAALPPGLAAKLDASGADPVVEVSAAVLPPGIAKKLDAPGADPVVPVNTAVLPPGIAKKLDASGADPVVPVNDATLPPGLARKAEAGRGEPAILALNPAEEEALGVMSFLGHAEAAAAEQRGDDTGPADTVAEPAIALAASPALHPDTILA